nr:FAD-binding protein [candidate division Zixibacteria bacterium]
MTDNSIDKWTALKDMFGERLILDTDNYPDYFRDASEIKVRASAIAFPDSESEIIAIINFCRDKNIPIVFRGAGTGYTGGAVPVHSGLVLSLENLKKLEILPDYKIALCGPGVVTIELMKAAAGFGLYYPPDPASYEESTLGGNVAECAGGLHCKKYGVTKDYVIGLRAVIADGAVLTTGFYSKGDLFDLTGIMIGSEGLLAAITEIAVSLIDQPETGPTILAAFTDPADAARTVAEITRRGIIPAVMEFMDGDAIACSMAYEKTIAINKVGAVLLFETSGNKRLAEADNIESICRENNILYLNRENDPAQTERLWRIRRNISKAVKESARHKIAEDVCVPPSRLSELVAFVAGLSREYPIRTNAYGHAGDGNLHVNFLTSSDDPDVMEMIDRAVLSLFEKTLELGGTLTGEHGIGLTKKDFFHLEFDRATIDHMKSIKEAFDPAGLYNPGKMFK